MKIYRHHTVEEKPAGSVIPCKHPDEIQPVQLKNSSHQNFQAPVDAASRPGKVQVATTPKPGEMPVWEDLVAQNGETEIHDITDSCDRKPTYGLGVMQMLEDQGQDLAQSARQRIDIDWTVNDYLAELHDWKLKIPGYDPLPPRSQTIIQVDGASLERESMDDLTLKYKHPAAEDLQRALHAAPPRIDYTKMPKLWTPK